jgi:hypothetical protein
LYVWDGGNRLIQVTSGDGTRVTLLEIEYDALGLANAGEPAAVELRYRREEARLGALWLQERLAADTDERVRKVAVLNEADGNMLEAAWRCDIASLSAALASGANFDATDPLSGGSVMTIGMMHGVEWISSVLQVAPRPDVPDDLSRTALHLALIQNNYAMASLLLNHGARWIHVLAPDGSAESRRPRPSPQT